MKIFFVHTSDKISPFDQFAQDLNIGPHTVLQRLTLQIESTFKTKAAKFSTLHGWDITTFTQEGLYIGTHLFCNKKFLQWIKKTITKENCSLTITQNVKKFSPLYSEKDNDFQQDIPVFYKSSVSNSIKNITVPSLSKINRSVLLPFGVYGLKDPKINFPKIFSLSIQSWASYLLANTLFLRQFNLQKLSLLAHLNSNWVNRLLVSPTLAKLGNRIGKGCKIHPTARIEASWIDDGVEIGPYAYILSSYIGKGTKISEYSSVKLSVIGHYSFSMPCDYFNAVVGSHSTIFTQIFHNSVFGDNSFIGAASGFSDYNFASTEKTNLDVPFHFLGSCVGHHVKIGAGIVFRSHQEIPQGTQIINANMLSMKSSTPNQIYAAGQSGLVTIPKSFL